MKWTSRTSSHSSHPWMRFRADLSKAPAELWILLGEAASKCERLGEFRKQSIVVGNYRGARAGACRRLVARPCDWLEGPDLRRDESQKMPIALLQAVLAHLYLAWIHPFGMARA